MQNNQSSYAYTSPRFYAPNRSSARHNSSTSNYANQTVAEGPTEQTARISSIGVSDLAPPQKDSVWASQTAPQETTIADSNPPAEQWRADNQAVAIKPVEGRGIHAEKGSEVKLVTEPKKTGFIRPVNGNKILSSYGPKGSGKANDGINIAASEGEPVWAVSDGEIVFVGDELSGYGNMVIIKHADNKSTTYAHLGQATVDKYDRVKQGDIIGYVGSTGNVKSPQLYFSVRDGKQTVDPQKYLGRNVAGL